MTRTITLSAADTDTLDDRISAMLREVGGVQYQLRGVTPFVSEGRTYLLLILDELPPYAGIVDAPYEVTVEDSGELHPTRFSNDALRDADAASLGAITTMLADDAARHPAADEPTSRTS